MIIGSLSDDILDDASSEGQMLALAIINAVPEEARLKLVLAVLDHLTRKEQGTGPKLITAYETGILGAMNMHVKLGPR